jgi:hydroxymethylbilane synthase
VADATILAAAGLNRLKIGNWPGVEFHALGFDSMVPAVGQAAVAAQGRAEDVALFAGVFDEPTARSVILERAFQAMLGGGCHTAFGAHVSDGRLYFFHEQSGMRSQALSSEDLARPSETAQRILKEFGFHV